jgi:hypothetical protein
MKFRLTMSVQIRIADDRKRTRTDDCSTAMIKDIGIRSGRTANGRSGDEPGAAPAAG